MDSFDISATNQIVDRLTTKLQRPLTESETRTFKTPRSGMAYEMIIDTIETAESKSELENYVKNVVNEYLNTHNRR